MKAGGFRSFLLLLGQVILDKGPKHLQNFSPNERSDLSDFLAHLTDLQSFGGKNT